MTGVQTCALPIYTDGTTQDVTSVVTWTSSYALVATISSSVGSYGLATSSGQGTTTISGTLSSISNSTTLSVISPVAVSITPANAAISLGGTQQFSALATYSDGSTKDVTASAIWTSSAPAVAGVNSSGMVTGLAIGLSTITVADAGLSSSASVTVGLAAVTVTPVNPSVPLGTSLQLSATGTYSDGSTSNITSLASWSTANSSVATVNAQGSVSAAALGGTVISATLGSFIGSTTISVTAPSLLSLAVTPASISIPFGSTQPFTATGSYSDGSIQNLTSLATWNSSMPGIATVSNGVGTQGIASGVGIGTTTISAAVGMVSGSASLTIANFPCAGGPCVLTSHNDLARDGVVNNENALTPVTVNSSTFGVVASITGLQGQIYAQPLYISGLYSASSKGNLILVATEENYAYAFDADSYQQVWGGSYIPSSETPVPTDRKSVV